jgi:hypothetical protein
MFSHHEGSGGLGWEEVGGLEDGAGDRIRTGDINLGKVALYQLSYSRLRVTSSFLLHVHSSVNSLKNLRQGANIFHLKWYGFPQP